MLIAILLLLGSVVAQTNRSDFDGDGSVGFTDFLLFAEAFGSSQTAFDLDTSGSVDFGDFLLFAKDFTEAPAPLNIPAWATRVLYVDSESGRDDNSGLSVELAFKTLKKAAEVLQPGDFVIVSPGVYHGPIDIHTKGSRERPITLYARDRQLYATVVTTAEPSIRSREQTWDLVDEELGLYSTPLYDRFPSRVLYSGNDLYSYSSLETLKRFTPRTDVDIPGPRHGYTYDEAINLLYVRLHPGGKYGSRNPNEHVMAVAPPNGEHFDGSFVTSSYHYNIGMLGNGASHITIDGFTFETPGVAGVYVESDDVTIRRGWFRGCRVGVAGNYSDEVLSPRYRDHKYSKSSVERSAKNIVIEYCDYSQEPAFHDLVETLGLADTAKIAKMSSQDRFTHMWARKQPSYGLPTNSLKYEMGIAARVSKDWIIRRNYIHDAFEGLSCHGASPSVGLLMYENVFQRILDNAVEAEDHAKEMHFLRNVCVDVLEPFSWQPLRGEPWPGPIYITHNIFVKSEKYADLFGPLYKTPGAFKLGAKPSDYPGVESIVIPTPGLIATHNTVLTEGNCLISPLADLVISLHGLTFTHNIFAVGHLFGNRRIGLEVLDGFRFSNNTIAPYPSSEPGPATSFSLLKLSSGMLWFQAALRPSVFSSIAASWACRATTSFVI